MNKVAALVATFNRKELLKKTINSLLNQSRKVDKIFIVNNASTDGTDKVLKEYENDYRGIIEIINLEENTGGTGGFNYGMEYIYTQKKYDWIWLMDDDAIPEKYALEKMLGVYKKLPYRKKRKIGVLQNEVTTNISTLDKEKKHKNLYIRKRNFAVFIGFLIKTTVIEKIGLPKKEYFIYFDDVEYGFRIKQRGYKCIRYNKLSHQDQEN